MIMVFRCRVIECIRLSRIQPIHEKVVLDYFCSGFFGVVHARKDQSRVQSGKEVRESRG